MTRTADEGQATLDAIDAPVLMLDLEPRIRRLNEPARRLLARPFPELVGRRLEDVGRGEPWRSATECVRLVRKGRSAVFCQARDAADGRLWDVAAEPVAAPGSGPERVMIVARDITVMTELHESLRRTETMAAMRSLVGGVVHEIRNPLFGISATLEALLAQFQMNDAAQEHLAVLRNELAKLGRLMQELLDYGEPHARDLKEGSIQHVLEDAVRACAPLAESSRVGLRIDLEPGLPPVPMNRPRLAQAFRNLVENAVRFSPPAQEVVLEARTTDENGRTWLACTVTDHGPGFAREDLPKVFEPFFTQRSSGTGLGLSIAQRIVEEHGGRIRAGNGPGGGAVLNLDLPLGLWMPSMARHDRDPL